MTDRGDILSIGAAAVLALVGFGALKGSASARPSAEVAGAAIVAWAGSHEAVLLLDRYRETQGSTWSAGGCLALAEALAQVLPGGRLVALCRGPSLMEIEHIAFEIEPERFLDADGLFTSSEDLVRAFQARERLSGVQLLRPAAGDAAVRRAAIARGIPSPPGLVADAAEALGIELAGASAPSGSANVECPRCGGTGQIRAFSHYAGGRCFLCGGTGRVEASSAPVAPGPVKAYREVELRGFGPGSISRDGEGFTIMFEHGQAWFDVIDGAVKVSMMSDGMVRRRVKTRDLEGALQQILKVRR